MTKQPIPQHVEKQCRSFLFFWFFHTLVAFVVIFSSWQSDLSHASGFEKDTPTVMEIHKKLNIENYDRFSDFVVTRTLDLRAQGLSPTSFMIFEEKPYYSQFGLGGDLLSMIEGFGVDRPSLLKTTRIVYRFLAALVVAAFVGWISTVLGWAFGLFTMLFFSIADWPILFAGHIYWTVFLLYLPFVLPWIIFQAFGYNKKVFMWLLVIHSLLVMLRCLFGYEYITCVILAPLPAFIFYSVMKQQNFSFVHQFKNAILIGLFGMVGFGLALTAHICKGVIADKMVPSEVIEKITERAAHRTKFQPKTEWGATSADLKASSVVFRKLSSVGFEGDYAAKLFLTAYYYSGYFFANTISLPGGFSLPFYGFLILLSVIAVFGYLLRTRFNAADQIIFQCFAFATLGSAVTSFSWWIMAINHMIVHIHFNSITLYMSFVPTSLVFMAFSVNRLFNVWFNDLRERRASNLG